MLRSSIILLLGLLCILPVYGDTYKNDTEINDEIVYEKLVNFEISLNMCKQNVTDNCSQVESKLNNIEQELGNIRSAISNHTSGSDVQWINGLNMTLAITILSLSITTLIIARSNKERKAAEEALRTYFAEITGIINEFKKSTDKNFEVHTTNLKEFNTNVDRTEKINNIIRDLREILDSAREILVTPTKSKKLSSEENEQLKLIDNVLSILKSDDYDVATDEYSHVYSIDEISKSKSDKYKFEMLKKHSEIVSYCIAKFLTDTKNEKMEKFLELVMEKIGKFEFR